MQWTMLMTGVLTAAAGCYAPVAKTTPAVGPGVRVSVAEGACHAPRAATMETSEQTGEVFARVRIENQSDRVLTFEPTQVWLTNPAQQAWSWKKQYLVEPRSDKTVTLRLASHDLRCDRELQLSLANSLLVDGRTLAVTPVRFVPVL
jgi:hypothetical protein